jgi:ABC-2 type transport system ATP-binding protein
MTLPEVLTARELGKHYAGMVRPAVDGLDLTIFRGEILGLLGPNGAGKTTTIAMLSTTLRPDRGRVMVCGLDTLRETRRARAHIGLVPQEIALYAELTAAENLNFFGRLQQLRGGDLKKACGEALAAVGLGNSAHQKVATFSGGMKRRTNLAAGLLHRPDLLFLDEPTVGIDAQSRQLILEKLLDLKSQGLTMLYTTHYMEEAAQLCDRVAIMDQGRLLRTGAPGELVADAGCRDLGELFLQLTGRELRD